MFSGDVRGLVGDSEVSVAPLCYFHLVYVHVLIAEVWRAGILAGARAAAAVIVVFVDLNGARAARCSERETGNCPVVDA